MIMHVYELSLINNLQEYWHIASLGNCIHDNKIIFNYQLTTSQILFK